ncbi:MAG: acyltransferase family protein, partial [Ilumatobacteraceae bacterium]
LATGGFLGVSVFFTLSGFLVGGQVLATAARPRPAPFTFLHRRLRRLAPASLATVVGVLALSRTRVATWGVPDGFAPTDVMTAICQVANWHLVGLPDHPGFRLFGPLAHFWSLSVEAQWYLGLAAMAAVVWLTTHDPTRRRRRLLALAGVAWVASLAAALVVHGSLRREEFGTDIRLAEFAAGILLAGVSTRSLAALTAHRRATDAAATAALGALVAATVAVGRDAAWLANGGYAALSMAWVVLIVGALHGDRVRRVLGSRPLAAAGRASYAAYLVHWPVVLLLTDARVPGGRAIAITVRLVVASLVASALYLVVEHRVRRLLSRWSPFAFVSAWAAITFVLWVGAVVTLGP